MRPVSWLSAAIAALALIGVWLPAPSSQTRADESLLWQYVDAEQTPPERRELSGVFHAVSIAGGRLKTGQIVDVGSEGIDVYNTILDAMGSQRRLGPADREVMV